jgi:hypothetical protein
VLENYDIWWDGYSLALTGGAIVDNYSTAPAHDRLAPEMLKEGDRCGRRAGESVDVVGGSGEVHIDRDVALLDRPVLLRLKEAMTKRFEEIKMAVDNSDMLMSCDAPDHFPQLGARPIRALMW